MEHLMLKAATAATADAGIFEAVISSATIDRERDIVDPAGMVRALKRWEQTGKMIPLAWMHSTKASDQIGYVDPHTARVVGDEVVASGWIDQDTEVGRHAWRLVKLGTLGFSFGYLTTKAVPREGGGRHLQDLDLFEITATSVPINPDTRVLGWKGATEEEIDDQRDYADAVARQEEEAGIPTDLTDESSPAVPSQPTEAPEAQSQRRKAAAVAAELENERIADRRRSEEEQLPVVSEPDPAPFDPVRIPEATEQRSRAKAFEQEILEARRRDPVIPELTPEPPPRRVPEPVAAPDTEEQWQKAVDVERQDVSDRRQREQQRIPQVPAEPEPEPSPDPRAKPPQTKAQRRRAARLERQQSTYRRRSEEATLPTVPPSAPIETARERAFVPDLEAQRRKAEAYERATVMAEREAEVKRLELKMSAEPFSTSKTSNWVARGGGLPHYIQHIAHDLMQERGMSESQAIQMAIGICQRWARGGANVSAKTRSEAAAAIAEWEALKAKAKTKALDSTADPNNVAEAPDTADLEALIEQMSPEEQRMLFEMLYSASSMKMHQQNMMSMGKAIPDDGELRQKARQIEREAEQAMEPNVPDSQHYEHLKLTTDEMADLVDGNFKGVHAALARMPQSQLPQVVKDRLVAKTLKILETSLSSSSKSADVTDDGHAPRSVDPLRARANAVALEHASGGESLRKPPQERKATPAPQPELTLDELRQRSRDEMLMALSGLNEV